MKKRILVTSVIVFAGALGGGVFALANTHSTKDIVSPKSVSSTRVITSPTPTTPPYTQQIPAPTQSVSTVAPSTTESEPATPTNPFPYGFAPWYVFDRRAQVGKDMPVLSDHKYVFPDYYCLYEIRSGYPTTTTPSVDDIACYSSDAVGFVEQVNSDGSYWLSTMNSYGQKSITDTTPWGGWDRVNYRLVPATNTNSFVFIH